MSQGLTPPTEIFSLHEDRSLPSQDLAFFMCMSKPFPFVQPREFLIFRRHYSLSDGRDAYVQMSFKDEQIKPERKSAVRSQIRNIQKKIMKKESSMNKEEKLFSFEFSLIKAI